MRRVQIHLDEDLDRAAAREARRRGISKAALIRESLAATVKRGEPTGERNPWEDLIGWLDDDPLDDIDEAMYGPAR